MTFDEWRETNKWCDPEKGRYVWEAATKAEREACAKVCEELAEAYRNEHDTAANHAGDDCAAAIRAR